jgi:hypothetical protein
VQTFVDEEVLYREAVAQGLERADPLVRRRLIEKMTALTRPVAPTQEPSRDQLRRWYLIYAHRFRRPTTVTFEQLFFDPQRRPDAGAAAAQALAGLARAKPSDPPPPTGDAFVLSAATNEKTQLELAHLLGETFAQAVLTAPVGSWSGPVRSTYGIHLVRVVRRTPERLPPFEEIEKTVRADWLTVETRGQRAAAEVLLPRYQLSLPAEVRRELAGAPALAPYLARAR